MAPEDPAVFLKSPPNLSDRAETLTRQVDKHAGADVEWWRFAELAVRHHDHATWIADKAEMESKIKTRSKWALGLLLANLALVATTIGHRLVEEGRSEERAEQQERTRLRDLEVQRRESDELRRQISELRADLRRLSGADKTGPGDAIIDDPDKYVAAPPAWLSSALVSGHIDLDPATCFQACNSNIECGGTGVLCKYCNFGECRSTRPEKPPADAGVDAGVDAPSGTTP